MRYIISEYELLTTLMKKPRQIIYLSMKSLSVFFKVKSSKSILMISPFPVA